MKSVLASLCMSLSMAMTVSGKKADDDLIETNPSPRQLCNKLNCEKSVVIYGPPKIFEQKLHLREVDQTTTITVTVSVITSTTYQLHTVNLQVPTVEITSVSYSTILTDLTRSNTADGYNSSSNHVVSSSYVLSNSTGPTNATFFPAVTINTHGPPEISGTNGFTELSIISSTTGSTPVMSITQSTSLLTETTSQSVLSSLPTPSNDGDTTVQIGAAAVFLVLGMNLIEAIPNFL